MKSLAYWFVEWDPPDWLQYFDCTWAETGNIAKLLGIPFGIEIDIVDVDSFLFQKIHKKLVYWTSLKLSLAGRSVIVNSVLLSTLWYFISIWGGSLAVIRKIRAQLWNFLWSRSAHRARSRVSWTDCCANKQKGGLNLIDLEEALDALSAKWVIKALTPGESNLKTLLLARIKQAQPSRQTKWPPTESGCSSTNSWQDVAPESGTTSSRRGVYFPRNSTLYLRPMLLRS
jgi:hypothetical protein